MTKQRSAEVEAVRAAVEAYYGKRTGSLRMLIAGIPDGLVEVLEPQLGRLESEVRGWRSGARLPDEVVLDLYLDTLDPEHPQDDLRPLADAAAEDDRQARLALRRGLLALGYGLEPDPHAPPATGGAPRWPALLPVPLGDSLATELREAGRYVLVQYGRAVHAALTEAQVDPIEEAQQGLYFPFAARDPDPPADGRPPVGAAPATWWQCEHGVELDWNDRKGWVHGPLDIWSGAGWEYHEPLPLPLFAHPEDIVAVVRQLLAGDRTIAPRTREWEHADALTMLWEQIETLERVYQERAEAHPWLR
ncbi:hypothetical protein [Kitasatospora terrestris]